jgi:hypothetical protein
MNLDSGQNSLDFAQNDGVRHIFRQAEAERIQHRLPTINKIRFRTIRNNRMDTG